MVDCTLVVCIKTGSGDIYLVLCTLCPLLLSHIVLIITYYTNIVQAFAVEKRYLQAATHTFG